ncbi:MAG TPA: DUF3008 family protein [Archangium sp.]|jgi:hypothetical protein|nr:DUF3008 family protein [Archangium sp.]
MPARSQAQQRAAGAALSAKRGQSSSDQLQGAARDMFDSMTEDELEALASTKLDGLPEHAADDPTPSRGD